MTPLNCRPMFSVVVCLHGRFDAKHSEEIDDRSTEHEKARNCCAVAPIHSNGQICGDHSGRIPWLPERERVIARQPARPVRLYQRPNHVKELARGHQESARWTNADSGAVAPSEGSAMRISAEPRGDCRESPTPGTKAPNLPCPRSGPGRRRPSCQTGRTADRKTVGSKTLLATLDEVFHERSLGLRLSLLGCRDQSCRYQLPPTSSSWDFQSPESKQ